MDLKTGENGDLKLIDNAEDTVKQIREQLELGFHRELNPFIGSSIEPFYENKLEAVKNIIMDFLKKDKRVVGGGEVNVCSRWKNMTFKQKSKWFFCNKIFKFIGRNERKRVDDLNTIIRDFNEFIERHYDEDEWWTHCKDEEPLVDWATFDPDQFIDVDMMIQIAQPLEFINLTLTLDNIKSEET